MTVERYNPFNVLFGAQSKWLHLMQLTWCVHKAYNGDSKNIWPGYDKTSFYTGRIVPRFQLLNITFIVQT